jgi:hypothetical protein
MAVLIKKICLLLLPFLLLAGYTEYRLGRMANGYSHKAEGIERWAPTTEVLILGSSHALYGIDPAGFQRSAYNLANVSQSHYYDYQIFSKYVNSLTQLRVVIVPLSYFSLDYSLANTPERWRRHFYRRYFNLPLEGEGPGTHEVLDVQRYSLIALYGVEQSVKLLRKNFRSDIATISEKGWQRQPANKSPNLSAARGRERAVFHHSLMLAGQDRANLGYLAALARAVQDAGARLVFVTLPVDRSYREAIESDRYRTLVDRANAFCAAQGCNYLNYFDDARFSGDDFFDSDHLNAPGAMKFSEILNADLTPILQTEKASTGGER